MVRGCAKSPLTICSIYEFDSIPFFEQFNGPWRIPFFGVVLLILLQFINILFYENCDANIRNKASVNPPFHLNIFDFSRNFGLWVINSLLP